MVGSPLGIILMVAALYLAFKSPRKLLTLGRMILGFVATAGFLLGTNAFLRIGDPRAWGAISGLVALLVAVIAGWWHVRSLARASTTSTRPS